MPTISMTSISMICGKRYIDRVEDVTKVTVYSNLPKVELFANGMSLGNKVAEDHFYYFDVPLAGETVGAGDKEVLQPQEESSSATGIFVFHKDITILQYFALLDQIKVHFDKEELLRINDQLSKIKKSKQ